jgi:hypothetical protein
VGFKSFEQGDLNGRGVLANRQAYAIKSTRHLEAPMPV